MRRSAMFENWGRRRRAGTVSGRRGLMRHHSRRLSYSDRGPRSSRVSGKHDHGRPASHRMVTGGYRTPYLEKDERTTQDPARQPPPDPCRRFLRPPTPVPVRLPGFTPWSCSARMPTSDSIGSPVSRNGSSMHRSPCSPDRLRPLLGRVPHPPRPEGAAPGGGLLLRRALRRRARPGAGHPRETHDCDTTRWSSTCRRSASTPVAPCTPPTGAGSARLCVIDHEPRAVSEEDAVVLADLARMLEQELKSLSLATLDELTRLTNRRGFDAIAEQTIAMCRRVGEPATLLYFDLDGFKPINDTLGHAAGDGCCGPSPETSGRRFATRTSSPGRRRRVLRASDVCDHRGPSPGRCRCWREPRDARGRAARVLQRRDRTVRSFQARHRARVGRGSRSAHVSTEARPWPGRCAVGHGLARGLRVTRDKKGFKRSVVRPITPAELVAIVT